MKTYSDQKHTDTHNYKPGDKVWLKGQNITTDRPLKNLDNKRYGPFEILQKISKAAYKLKLPCTWHSIWPVFNEIFLTPYKPPTFESQIAPPQSPPEIIDEEEEYKVEKIMDSKLQ
jgi:hypothetical protein